MESLSNIILAAGTTGYLTSTLGILTGLFLSFFMKERGKKFRGTALGFIGGLMLAVVCFDLLPEAFEAGNVYVSALGLTFGAAMALLLEGKLNHDNMPGLNINFNRYFKAALFMAIGIGIHNLPSGIALGSLNASAPLKELHLATALIMHSIPEGLTLGIFLRESKAGLFSYILISVLTSIPMGLGAIIGSYIIGISPVVICISLALAGGMILYIIYHETLPHSREIWNGRLCSFSNVVGMAAGVFLNSTLH